MTTTALLADDDPITQAVVSGYLEDWGYEVICAASGQEALEYICRRSFSIFLLDLYMDDMSGLDVLHEVRQTPRLATRPVLMISAEQHPASMEVALQFGANDYLTKPIDARWLEAKLRRHLPERKPVLVEPLAAGSRLGRYQILEHIGESPLYLARDLELKREVNLKLGGPTEARALARVRHPNVLGVLDVGSDPVPYFVTEYGHGVPLEPGDQDQAVHWTLQILDGLEAVHDNHIVLANLSPENLLITRGGRVQLTDFSAALTDDSGSGYEGIVLKSSAAFAAPEQVDALFGAIGPRADLFSVASVLYYLLTGHPPFTPELPFQQLLALAFAHPAPMGDDIPDCLKEICLKGLQKEQSQRFQSAAEFRNQLTARYLS